MSYQPDTSCVLLAFFKLLIYLIFFIFPFLLYKAAALAALRLA